MSFQSRSLVKLFITIIKCNGVMEVLKSPFNIMKGLFFVTVISKSFNLISKSTTQDNKRIEKKHATI